MIPDVTGIMHPGPDFDAVLVTSDGRAYVYNYIRVQSDLFLVEDCR